jgi:hypothetical protein
VDGKEQGTGMAASTSAGRPWLGVGIGLFVLGSVALLAGNALVVAAELPQATAWLAVPGLVVGGVSLAVGVRLGSAPERVAAAGGLGMLVLVLDLVGLSEPPRVIPGALLLAGAAVVAGSRRPAGGRLPPLAVAAVVVGAVTHAAVGLALVPLGLVVPAWAVLLLLVVWAALLAVVVRHRASRPLLFLAAPLATAAITAATLYLGGTYLRWTP